MSGWVGLGHVAGAEEPTSWNYEGVRVGMVESWGWDGDRVDRHGLGGSQALPPIMHRGREHPAGQDGHRQVLNDILTTSAASKAFPQVCRSQIYINVK